jgi:hypothetical protein
LIAHDALLLIVYGRKSNLGSTQNQTLPAYACEFCYPLQIRPGWQNPVMVKQIPSRRMESNRKHFDL